MDGMTTASATDRMTGELREEARRAAAELLESLGRHEDARIIRAGGGDDFPEVRVALLALCGMAAKVQRLERALRCYTDETLWEAHPHSEPLAVHDGGAMARAALAGREAFELHRD